jgi:hypothetical protein
MLLEMLVRLLSRNEGEGGRSLMRRVEGRWKGEGGTAEDEAMLDDVAEVEHSCGRVCERKELWDAKQSSSRRNFPRLWQRAASLNASRRRTDAYLRIEESIQ